MAQRKAFPLRLDPSIYDALQRWSDAEMRSMNAQIEFLLRRALKQAGRLPRAERGDSGPEAGGPPREPGEAPRKGSKVEAPGTELGEEVGETDEE
jgi:hypothetical protein